MNFYRFLRIMLDPNNEAGLAKNENNAGDSEENQNNDSDNKNATNVISMTQAQFNAKMKEEKEKGRRSVLRDLGVEDVKNAKESLAAYQKHLDSQKTDLQKATDDLSVANAKIAEAEKRALKAEYGLKAISKFGAVAESIDDLISIAIAKVTEDKTIETVFTEMKENKAYSGFFNSENSVVENKSKGTGNPISNLNRNTENGVENYGAQLAKKKLGK